MDTKMLALNNQEMAAEIFLFREGCREKNPYFLWSFAKPGGGGSARVVKKPYCFFEKVFFFREHVESF